MRRTASWSTSDAFTDGHMAEDSEMLMPGLRTKAATSRAHGFRRYHQGTMGRSSSDAQSRSFDVRLLRSILQYTPPAVSRVSLLSFGGHKNTTVCLELASVTKMSWECRLHRVMLPVAAVLQWRIGQALW